jgi:hypothetical protein
MCEGGRPLVAGPRLGDGVRYSLLIFEGGRPRVGVPSANCCCCAGCLEGYARRLGLGDRVRYSLLILDGDLPLVGGPCGG